MRTISAGLIVLAIVGATGFYVLKTYFPNLAPPSKDIKQYLPLNESTNSPIKVPSGTKLDVFTDLRGELPNALAIDERGTLFASLTNVGKVVALPDFDGNKKADRKLEILTGLTDPQKIAFDDKYLYVSEGALVSRYEYDQNTFTIGPKEPLSRIEVSNIDMLRPNTLTQSYKPLGETVDNNGNLFISKDYKVIKLSVFAGSVTNEEEYISGFVLGANEVLGRPTGLVFDSANNLFIADDESGLIYVLTR